MIHLILGTALCYAASPTEGTVLLRNRSFQPQQGMETLVGQSFAGRRHVLIMTEDSPHSDFRLLARAGSKVYVASVEDALVRQWTQSGLPKDLLWLLPRTSVAYLLPELTNQCPSIVNIGGI